LESSNLTETSSSSFHQQAQIVAHPDGHAGEIFAFEDAPLLEHGHDHLVEVDPGIINAFRRIRCADRIAWSGAMSSPAALTSR